MLDDLIRKKSKNINILLGANVDDINAQKGSWDLCISNGMDIIDEKYQQKNWPSYQEFNENGKNIPGQVILDWNKPKEMEGLSILKGRVNLIAFDWSSSGLEFWNGELRSLIPMLQPGGVLFIEEYIKSMILKGNFLIPMKIETYLNPRGSNWFNDLFKKKNSLNNIEAENKILFGKKNIDIGVGKIYDGNGLFNLDTTNNSLLINDDYKNEGVFIYW